jgi:hypothetical protein
MKKGKCKLCLRDNVDLLTRSHIIPKFLFADMKDQNNSFVQIQPGKYVKGRNQHVKFPRDSFHEGEILCEDCDGKILKKYEDYLKLTFHNSSKAISRPTLVNTEKDVSGMKTHEIVNVDYTLFKLGFLSILWRASISKLPEFSIVSLGEMHTEKLRKMLIEENAGEINDYPFFVSLLDPGKAENKFILPMSKFKSQGFTHYRLVLNGLDIMFMVGSPQLEINSKLLRFIPNHGNKLTLVEHEENYGKKLFTSHAFKGLMNKGRL